MKKLYTRLLKYPNDIVAMAIAALLLTISFGCSPEACLTIDEPVLMVGFYKKNRIGSAVADSIQRVIITQVYGIGAKKDSILIKTKATYSKLRLPLPANSSNAGFVIVSETPTINRDTFFVDYDKNIKFISASCGFTNYYTNLKLKSHTFDSVSVIATQADSITKNIHLKIYF